MAELPSEFPPPRALDARPHNLPVERGALLGRARELAQAERLLLRDDVGLLTLTGPGGTGKTRLGLQIAAELIDRFADGVFFVALAPISDPRLVASAIAQALGVREAGSRPVAEGLKEYLRDRALLLVLDNFEQILPAAPLVAELLATGPRLKVLVTSRAALQVRGEFELPVPPLALPDADQALTPETLAQYPATALFVERVVAMKPDFSLADENAAAVAEICARLDGLPLAIELAAARCRLLAPSGVLARLGRRLTLLSGGPRDVPTRQQTLRDTIGWSYDLLDVAEQRLFRRLAVFVGGCTLEAAEAVCDPSDELGIDLFEGVASLAAKSLLRQDDRGGEPRSGMLETIREFGLERLDANAETDETRRWHAEYFLALAESAELKLEGAEQSEWLTRLEQEHDNLRAALAWSLAERADAELGLRLAGVLCYFWFLHGHYSEGRRWLQEALAGSDGTSVAARAKALYGSGFLTRWQHEYRGAEPLLEQALELYRILGDDRGAATTLNTLAFMSMLQGAFESATPMLEEGLRLSRKIGDAYNIARSLNNLGYAALQQGDYERAAILLAEGLAASREIGDEPGAAVRLGHLGEVMRARHDFERATALLDESLALSQRHGFMDGTARAFHRLGLLAHDQGDVVRARACFSEGITCANRAGDRLIVVECLEGFAAIAARWGEAESAAWLFGAAEAIRRAIGAPLPPYWRADHDATVAALHARLGDDRFSSAWAVGRAMPFARAVEYARSIGEETPVCASASDDSSRDDRASPLSARELEVAGLVARGLTNRQIAAALVISDRTAGSHIAHILDKLDFTTRSQIAAWAVEHDLVKQPLTN